MSPMSRRDFLSGLVVLPVLGGMTSHLLAAPAPPRSRAVPSISFSPRRGLSLEAVFQGEAFRHSSPPDARYHALVSRGGGASGKSLLVTEVEDGVVAAELRRLGAGDGGGVPMEAWSRRNLPFARAPRTRVRGTPVTVTVSWEEGPRGGVPLAELLDDPGGEGIQFRFGGNEEHDEHWDSGCILCLYSCPGGVISNARYTIRDHRRGLTDFTPSGMVPPDGTVVRVELELPPA